MISATTDPAVVVATSDLVTVLSVVGHSGKRRMMHGTLFCGVVATLRLPRRISRLGEKDGRSTTGGTVLGVTVSA